MPEIFFERTIAEGIEGDSAIAHIRVKKLKDFEKDLEDLNKIQIRLLNSAFFGGDLLNTSEDLGDPHPIQWTRVTKTEATGQAQIEIKKDDKEEPTEGCLLYINVPRDVSRNKFSKTTPSFAMLIARDASSRDAFSEPSFWEKWKTEAETSDNIHEYRDYLLQLQSMATPPPYTTGSYGMYTYPVFAAHKKHKGRERILTNSVTDLFQHEGEYYAFAVWNSADSYVPEEYKGLVEGRCCKTNGTQEQEHNEVPLLRWKVISEEEVKKAAIASGYDKSGKFGFLFGNKSEKKKQEALDKFLEENISPRLQNRMNRNTSTPIKAK